MSNAILKRMPSGVPGDISRRSVSLVEGVLLDSTAVFTGYGVPGKKVSGKLVPVAAADVGTVVTHFIARPYPTQTANSDGSGISTSKIGEGMRRGYMTVKNNAGVPAEDGQVYVRVAAAAAGKPIGGVEAAADAGNCVAIPNCIFTHAADAAGNVEIRFNL
jgi:hypothetical protein